VLLAVQAALVAREALALHRAPAEVWLGLSRNAAVIDAARGLPPDTLIASNYSVLFRIDAGRAVRQLDVSGRDANLAGSLAQFARLAGARPAVFLLVCDAQWTARFSACQPVERHEGPPCERVASRPAIVARCPANAAAGRAQG